VESRQPERFGCDNVLCIVCQEADDLTTWGCVAYQHEYASDTCCFDRRQVDCLSCQCNFIRLKFIF